MINSTYAKAYTEILEIISHFSKEDYSKIPPEKIEFYENNMDKNYSFKINPEVNLSEQHISKEANSIMINLYLNYYASEKQKTKIYAILEQNQKISESKKREKYNQDDIFINNNTINPGNAIINDNNLPLEIKKESFFYKFITYIKNLFLKFKSKN